MRAPLCALAIAATILARPLVAQHGTEFPVDKCRSPAEPIGLVTASGRVTFLLGIGGHPDTSSIRVLNVETISPAAYRSVAARLLGACRFRIPKDAAHAPIPVSLSLDLEGNAERPPNAVREPRLVDGLAIGTVLLSGSPSVGRWPA